MNELENIPFEELKAEYERRLQLQKEEKAKKRSARISCENCAFRILGRVYMNGVTDHETWVCERQPKKSQSNRSYTGKVLPYTRAYRACLRVYSNKCKMFVNRNSDEGRRIIEERKSMSDYVSDYE